MKNLLKHYWDALTSSLWFVPAVMTVLALGAGFGAIQIDNAVDSQTSWTYSGGPEGARELLATIAGSMITVAGVSFSIMIVALTLASQQFGPRLLKNFMRDTSNQVVLGTFIATFTYCLIILRTIRAGDSEFVPHISVTLAIVLALCSLGVLIHFIHHAAVSIQAPELLAFVAKDVERGINRLFPERIGRGEKRDDKQSQTDHLVQSFENEPGAVRTTQSGYIQSIDGDRLLDLAQDKSLTLLLTRRPGDFVLCGQELVKFRPFAELDERTAKSIREAFLFGTQRTHLQDVEFSLRQLVEVAVRALSPGINDPFTAMNAIDHIAAALSQLAERAFPSALRCDDSGALRIIAPQLTFDELVRSAFDQIRQYGRSSVPVNLRLLSSIAAIADHARRETDRHALLVQVRAIAETCMSEIPEYDRSSVEQAVESALAALRAPRASAGEEKDAGVVPKFNSGQIENKP